MGTGLKLMTEILSLPKERRKPKDLAFLASFCCQKIDFFKQLTLNEKTMLQVVNCMTNQHMAAGETVMEFGDIGINFYLILQGEVEIMIPDPDHKKTFI